jgi:hypothetical protein
MATTKASSKAGKKSSGAAQKSGTPTKAGSRKAAPKAPASKVTKTSGTSSKKSAGTSTKKSSGTSLPRQQLGKTVASKNTSAGKTSKGASGNPGRKAKVAATKNDRGGASSSNNKTRRNSATSASSSNTSLDNSQPLSPAAGIIDKAKDVLSAVIAGATAGAATLIGSTQETIAEVTVSKRRTARK